MAVGTFSAEDHERSPECNEGRSRVAAGLGLEPRLPDPESGVLPLDDPAKVIQKCQSIIRNLANKSYCKAWFLRIVRVSLLVL